MENEVKEPALKYNYISSEEYLNAERGAKERHELHHVQIVKLPGSSINHGRIVSHLLGNIGPYLKDTEYSIFITNLRLAIPSVPAFTYPDVSIVGGEPEMLDEHLDNLTNPSVIIEVLSPQTEQYDRGNKFFYYIKIESLKEYIMISSTSYYVQIARKQEDDSWNFEEITDLNSTLQINTIQFKLDLSAIYERVKF